jgi:hypothetical protein
MRNFFARHELVWILPLVAIVSYLSVSGLNLMKKVSTQPAPKMVSIHEIRGYDHPDGMDQIYCKSSLIIDNPGTDSEHRSVSVVFDGWYRPGSLVALDTICSKASQAFVDKAIYEGFRWQGSGVEIEGGP